jgi:hypothetical protein
MAKLSKNQLADKPITDDSVLPEQGPALENEHQSGYDRVGLRLIYPAHVIHTGLVTGEQYDWTDAGSVTMVDSRDVAELLAIRAGGAGCCGGSGNVNGYPFFELAN